MGSMLHPRISAVILFNQGSNSEYFVNWTQLTCFQLITVCQDLTMQLSFCTIPASTVRNPATTRSSKLFALEQPKQGWVLLWTPYLFVNIFLEANWALLVQLVWLASKPPGFPSLCISVTPDFLCRLWVQTTFFFFFFSSNSCFNVNEYMIVPYFKIKRKWICLIMTTGNVYNTV